MTTQAPFIQAPAVQSFFSELAPAGIPPFAIPLAVGVLLILLALWLVVRARAPRKARAAGERRDPLGRRLGRASSGGLRRFFGETLAVGRYLTTRREWRYRQPWVVLLGEAGAGKSSIAESISVGRRETLLLKEQRLSAPDSEWLFFNRGVLIDIGGATANGDEGSGERERWHEVLERLDDYRPERPVDAAVLTISAATLLRGDGAELHDIAERCYRQLWEMQKRLDLTFPVYLVVSRCDAVPGFHDFWGAQPEELRKQIFGWSTPHALTHGFSPRWIDDAFTAVDAGLNGLQLNVATAGGALGDPDRFFLFPRQFAALAAPLKAVLGHVFRSGALHEDFYFRGLYFTGTTEPDEPGAEPPLERTDIAFVDELFDERVFRETHLARPTRQGVLSRNRFIRRFQLTMMVLAALLVLTLGVSTWSLNEQINSARHAHELIKASATGTADTGGDGRCTEREPLYELLEDVAHIGLDLRYWSIPASWFDRRVNRINRKEIAHSAFEGVIFPALACRLEQRARQLTAADGRVTPKGDPSAKNTDQALAGLVDYAAQSAELALNVERFRALARHNQDTDENFDEFARLVHYLYQAPLPMPVKRNRGLLRASLAHVEYKRPLTLPEAMERRVSEILGLRAAAAAEQVELRLRHGSQLLAELAGQPSLDDIRALHRWLLWVRDQWLDSSTARNLCSVLDEELKPSLTLLEAQRYPDLETTVRARFTPERCYAPAIGYLAGLRVAPYGPLFKGDGEGLTITDWMALELKGFQALLDQDFMKVKPTDTFGCRTPLRGWREEKLAEAARYLRQYEAFANAHGLSLDGHDPRLFERLGRIHLKAVMDDLFAAAQERERIGEQPSGLTALSVAETALADRSEAFRKLLDPLISTLEKYRRLGFTAAQSQVLQCARDYAADTLGGIERLADGSRLYEVDSNLGALDPDTPYFDLGTAAQTKGYLARQLERGEVLAGYAEPFVTFLKNSATVNDANRATVDTAGYWEGTIDEINRLVQFKDPAGQAALLEGFISDQMSGLTQANCQRVLNDYQRPTFGNDLFSRRRDQLTFLADWFCRDHAVAGVLDDYRALAQRFNGELAGRFPFGSLESRDADPGRVRRFFRDYATLRAPLGESLESLKGPEWDEVRAFIARLDEAATLFNATLAAADGEYPMALQVGFRERAKQSPGSEQVIGWRLDSGLESATYPNGEERVTWRFGDPLTLSLDWAQLSPVQPLADGDQPDLGVSGRTAAFTSDGPWALLRMLARHRVDYLDQADKMTLGFTVPVRVEGAVPRHATAVHARMYLALSPAAIDPKTQAETPLALPASFPAEAPMPR